MHQSRASTMSVAPYDVWPEQSTAFPDVNLEPAEQRFSIVSGTLVLFGGLRRRSLPMILGGGFLLYRGIRGYCPVYRALERSPGYTAHRWLVLRRIDHRK